MADARDLKSLGLKGPCRFESGLRHQQFDVLPSCRLRVP